MKKIRFYHSLKISIVFLLTQCISQALYAEVECPKGTKKMSTVEQEYTINWCSSIFEQDESPTGSNFFEATLKKVFKNLNGPLEMINSDSKVVLETNYKKGLLDGEFKKYYSDGSKMARGSYKLGIATGVWKRYYENGELKDEGKMYNGQPEGQWKFYDSNGKLTRTKDFDIKIADAKSRIRFGAFEVSMESPSCYNCPGGNYYNRNTKTELFLGYDRKMWDLGKSLRLRWVSDLSTFNFPTGNTDPNSGDNYKRIFVLLTTANFEWVPSWYQKLSISARLGGVVLSEKNSSGDRTDSAYGLELRYYFDQAYYWGVDSFFVNFGVVGGGDSKSNGGDNKTDTTLFGFQFAI